MFMNDNGLQGGKEMFLEIKDLKKGFGSGDSRTEVLRGIDFSVEKGEFCVLLGPSGSGKSTLLNIIGLILKPDSGSVAVGGEEVLSMNDRRCSAFRNASFGYIAQDFALLDDETVYHNIRIPLLYNRQIKRREHKPRIREIAQKLDISDKLNRKAGKLSGGERQRWQSPVQSSVTSRSSLRTNPPVHWTRRTKRMSWTSSCGSARKAARR